METHLEHPPLSSGRLEGKVAIVSGGDSSING